MEGILLTLERGDTIFEIIPDLGKPSKLIVHVTCLRSKVLLEISNNLTRDQQLRSETRAKRFID